MKVTKLTEEELQAIDKIKMENELIIKEFGSIKLAEINLKNRITRAEEFLTKLRKKEDELAKGLEDKYGKGTVNMSTGEFNSI